MEHELGGQAVLGRQLIKATPWLTERHGYDPTSIKDIDISFRHGQVDVYWEHLLEPDTGHGSRNDLFNIKDIWKD